MNKENKNLSYYGQESHQRKTGIRISESKKSHNRVTCTKKYI